jgi:hypothetical protein
MPGMTFLPVYPVASSPKEPILAIFEKASCNDHAKLRVKTVNTVEHCDRLL